MLVMTEAIFVSTILADPELSGVSAVLFDEATDIFDAVDPDLTLEGLRMIYLRNVVGSR